MEVAPAAPMRFGFQVETHIPQYPPPPARDLRLTRIRWIQQYRYIRPPVLRAIRKPSIRRHARHARSTR